MSHKKLKQRKRRTLSSPSQSLQRHLPSALCLGGVHIRVRAWAGGQVQEVFALLLSLLVVLLLDCLPSILYSAPAPASSQTDGGYQILPALFGYNREGVRRGFLHHLSYVHVEKSSPKCSRQVEKWLCRPEEFLKWKVLWFFNWF